MKKLFIILTVLGLGSFLMYSCQKADQENLESTNTNSQVTNYYSLGCMLLPADEYAKIPEAKVPNVEIKATVLTLDVPPVGDQGGEGSCVAWGTTYAGRSINWKANHSGSWSTSVNIFSPEYVYNQIKSSSSCGSGSYVTSGLNLLQSQGVCTWASMPYTDVSCSTLPTTAQKTEAANYKISSYSKITISTSSIKSFLAAGKPVIVAGSVNSAYMYLGYGSVLKKFTGSSLGGHCYCIVGYDDNKGAFKFMNSWGTSWATDGFGYIGYGYEKKWWSEAYVIN